MPRDSEPPRFVRHDATAKNPIRQTGTANDQGETAADDEQGRQTVLFQAHFLPSFPIMVPGSRFPENELHGTFAAIRQLLESRK
jgi:hypothetical protein